MNLTELMLKDLRLALAAADATGTEVEMGAAAMRVYETFVEEENGAGTDFSAMLPRFENRRRGAA